MPNRLYLNIGNTHTEVGLGPDFSAVSRYETADILAQDGRIPELEVRPDEMTAVASCVVPKMRQCLGKRYGGLIHFISAADFPELDFSHYDISTLGTDRIANVAQAWEYCHSAVMVIDCGTAINTELLDAQGRFLGGVILPGRAMQRRALHEFTAQLPLVEMTGVQMEKAAGTNTAEAIALGIDCGCVGAVRELCRRTRNTPGLENCRLLAIGGDRNFFLSVIAELEAAPEYFTLRGLLAAKV